MSHYETVLEIPATDTDVPMTVGTMPGELLIAVGGRARSFDTTDPEQRATLRALVDELQAAIDRGAVAHAAGAWLAGG